MSKSCKLWYFRLVKKMYVLPFYSVFSLQSSLNPIREGDSGILVKNHIFPIDQKGGGVYYSQKRPFVFQSKEGG